MAKQLPPSMTAAERQARGQAKRQMIVDFLAGGEVFTVAEIVADLCSCSRPVAIATLKAMERDGYIKSEPLVVGSRKLMLYGITPHGLALADRCGDPHHELSRTNPSWVPHRLDRQRMRLKAIRAGWGGWQTDRLLLNTGLKKVPDAISTDPAGAVVAIEIERHAKTPKRYAEVITAYIQEIKAGKYKRVDFVCPDDVALLVERSFKRVESVKHQGETVTLTDAHRARFRFWRFSDWPGDGK